MSDTNSFDSNEMGVGFFDAVEAEEEMPASLREDEEQQQPEQEQDTNNDTTGTTAEQLQRARDHSYLPGPSHPLLHGEAALQGGSSHNLNYGPEDGHNPHLLQQAPATKQKPLTEIPILELPGVVLFPGCTLPIRLSNRPWIQYLGRQIDASRKVGNPDFGRTVQLGILTLEDNPTIAAQQRQRSYWLRRGVTNTQRQRRLSRILQRELLGIEEDTTSSNEEEDEGVDGNNNHNHNANSRRHLHPYIGRVGTIATITYTHGDAVLDDSSDQNNRNSSTSNSGVWQHHAEQQRELIIKAVGTTRFQVDSYLEFQSFAEVQVFQVQEFEQDNNPLPLPRSHMMGFRPYCTPFNVKPAAAYSEQQGDDGTNNDYWSSSTSTADSPTSSRNLEASIINKNSSEAKAFLSRHESLIRQLSMVAPTPYLVWRQTWPWRIMGELVQMLEHETKRQSIQGSRDQSNRGTGNGTSNANSDDNTSSTNTMDTDADDDESEGGQHRKSSLLASLSELLHQDDSLLKNPTQFSFWMASNMPFSIQEKLELLQAQCTIDRLKLLKAKLADYTRPTSVLCCQGCHVRLARVDNVFTVGGADGTTGNYVNEHGFIHQVLTLRRVRESKLFCAGRASTENRYVGTYVELF